MSYHLIHSNKNVWQIKKSGALKSSFVFNDYKKAFSKILLLAYLNNKPIYIHEKSGRIINKIYIKDKL